MSEIINTSKYENHPEWCMGRNPTAIEDQEKRGQQQFINSMVLPTECDTTTKKELESMGVVFGDPIKDDPLFCNASLPKGWSKKATDHSMWSDLFNEKGEKVASIFYKAAFYDRSAFIRIN